MIRNNILFNLINFLIFSAIFDNFVNYDFFRFKFKKEKINEKDITYISSCPLSNIST